MWPVIAAILGLVDKVVPDKAQAADLKEKIIAMAFENDNGQINTNIAQAQSSNPYSAAARPTAMYMCIIGIFCATTVRWALSCFNIHTPPMDVSTLVMLLTGMLGLGGYRMVEKLNGVAS